MPRGVPSRYNSSLKSLSTLQLMGSHAEARNYITMLARILSRLTTEDGNASCGQWSRIQDALISSVWAFSSADQVWPRSGSFTGCTHVPGSRPDKWL